MSITSVPSNFYIRIECLPHLVPHGGVGIWVERYEEAHISVGTVLIRVQLAADGHHHGPAEHLRIIPTRRHLSVIE
jgi:hypothetical protein